MILAPLMVNGAVDPIYRIQWSSLAIVTTLVLMVVQDLYLARVCTIRWRELQGIWRSVTGGGLMVLALEQLARADLPLREIAGSGALAICMIVTSRAMFAAWLRRQRAAGLFVRDVVIVGADGDAVELAAVMREHPELGFRACGFVGDPKFADKLRVPCLGEVKRAAAVVNDAGCSGALVVASAMQPETLNSVVRELLSRDIRVQLSSGLRGIAHQRFRATPLAYEPLFFIEPISLSSWQIVIKRAVDILGAMIALTVGAPLFATIAVAIKVDTRGPVLFRQQRVGRNGRLFSLLKFRSMVNDSERHRQALSVANERTDGPLFKMAGDPRITRMGSLLRACSLDELPQLFNVLAGSMSLVGPRPALPREVAQFDDRLKMRAQVKPGLTGLWQIEARDNPAFGPYRRLDLFYVENWSPMLDGRIMLATLVHVIARAFRHMRRGTVESSPRSPQASHGLTIDIDECDLVVSHRR